jgi:hypothetical protein
LIIFLYRVIYRNIIRKQKTEVGGGAYDILYGSERGKGEREEKKKEEDAEGKIPEITLIPTFWLNFSKSH